MTYPVTAATTPHRLRDRVGYDRAAVHAVLDEAWYCHLAFVADGAPAQLPTMHVRLGETVYLHGSTGSGPMLAARAAGGLRVCLAVTLLDGLVYARSQFHHSANFRCVVAHGTAAPVTEAAERDRAFAALVDKLGPGRAADSRGVSPREHAQTALLRLELTEVSLKSRAGAPADDPEDLDLPHWAGVVPLRLTPGTPVPDAGTAAPAPAYLPS
ncbi:hypothetical protein GCM10010124_20160 [Pilimelia terevasa]|uniref:Pyridoxamine 5'-phosphate oxidase family protein n=1 Tax=Pilimelia terevasa TaxID=53372 RepID=A0A8J3BJU5_9ACTN|nr:pyridoxamine 5'-phosphate oxidase family protein [Pilimelia terevasa]GGK27538.1 hypothetical protein GCM10010124_20160 [Pilimelia terevasa]